MVVAVARVRVVQVAIHQVIRVVPVGNGLVTTPRPMAMRGLVPAAGVLRRAPRGVPAILLEGALVHVPRVLPVQVALVKVIHVVMVLDGGMAAAGGMSVGVLIVGLMAHHGLISKD